MTGETMIKHIVMWRLKKIKGKTKESTASEIEAEVNKLPNLIKEIKAFEVGINVNPSERASDVALVSEFKSIDALKKYQDHHEHLKVVALLQPLTKEVRVIDYEM
jgi:hypothetical protein